MVNLFELYKAQREKHLLYLWTEIGGKWISCGTLYPEVGWRFGFILPRGKRALSMLQLQHKSWRQPVYLWKETWRRKSKRTLRSKK